MYSVRQDLEQVTFEMFHFDIVELVVAEKQKRSNYNYNPCLQAHNRLCTE
jgi:hypothetical protein